MYVCIYTYTYLYLYVYLFLRIYVHAYLSKMSIDDELESSPGWP